MAKAKLVSLSNSKSILIVETERIIAKDLKMYIESLGYSVPAISSSGEHAIELCEEYHPDIILMDIKLKGVMSGINVAKIIIEKYHIPVIFCSTHADVKTVNTALQANPLGFLVNPFDEITLQVALKTAFHQIYFVNALEIRELRFRKLIEENTDGIIVINFEGKICFANKAAELLYERNNKKLIGEQIEFTVLERGFTEIEVLAKSGNIRTIELHITRTEWEKEKAYLATLRDVTDRKKIKDELLDSNLKLHNLIGEIVKGLMITIEMRDPYSSGHQKRVSKLATAIAEEMNLPDEKIEGLRITSLIHDIGIIHVPFEIINKPGLVTELEYELIKSHPQDGYDILKEITFPWPVAQIVLQHHEYLDGSGYPNALKGEDIILEAWILSVADVVEAMSSHRPHRPSLGINAALKEISDKKGILYDEHTVDACMTLFNEKGFTFEEAN